MFNVFVPPPWRRFIVAPQFTSGTTASTPENTTAVMTCTATGNGTMAYSITGGADSSKFSIGSSTGVLTFLSAPDYEAPGDVGGDNVYNVTVGVSNGLGGSNTRAIAVTVTDVADAPQITSPTTDSTPENSTAVMTCTATGPGVMTWSIAGGADSAKFSIGSSNAALRFVTAPDFDNPTDSGLNNVYNVTVGVSSSSGSNTQAIAVTVTDVNEPPQITSATTDSTPENTTAVMTCTATGPGTMTWSISGGTDSAKFSIGSSNAALRFVTAPDYENPTDSNGDNVYNVTVGVSSSEGSNTRAIAVTVTNVSDVSPGSQNFTASGNFTVPNYNSLVVNVWGGGGGGAAAGIDGPTAGGNGGQSKFNSPTAMIGNGGSAGTVDTVPDGGTEGQGGNGGTASGGTTNTTGDPGTDGAFQWQGGNGGDCPGGGNGGGGAFGSGAASNGGVPGGGGGGGGYNGATAWASGGGGGGGRAQRTFAAGALTVGAVIAVTVGSGGANGGVGTRGSDGGDGGKGQVNISWS